MVVPVPANIVCLVHAPGPSHRDPSVPLTYRFPRKLNTFPVLKAAKKGRRRSLAGVYKLDDDWQNIEAAMALNKDEGKKYIKEMFEEFDHSFGKDILPMLVLMFGAGGIQTYLGIRE